jgi:hypothetical protein
MSEYILHMGRIPSNINFDDLLNRVKGNSTRKRYLKDGMIYFLSLLTTDNYYTYKSKDGFRNINDDILSYIIGKGEKTSRTSEIKKILLDKGIIEIRPHRKGHYSRGYRLSEQFNTGVYSMYEFSDRIKTKLNQHHNNSKISSDFDYTHIYHQFKHNNLSVDLLNAQIYLRNLGTPLYEIIKRKKKFQEYNLMSLFNFLGRGIGILSDIENKNYFLSDSETNHRFHSNITALPKILRPFLLINGEKIGEVDIKTSQPYILSTIMNDKFFNGEEWGYNLRTIYPKLKNDFISLRNVVPSKQSGRNNYLMGVYFNNKDFKGIQNFVNTDFTNDFYDHIISEGNRLFPKIMSSNKGFKNGRDYVKKHIMNFLFERNEFHRIDNPVIDLLKHLYPPLCEYVERFTQSYTNNEFSYLLQRIEAFLILENVCNKLHKEFPSVPFFTIHDSILTTQSNINLLQNYSSYTINKITTKPVGMKSKVFEPFTIVSDDVVQETLGRIHITSERDFGNKVNYFLAENVNKGMRLLQ